MLIRNLNAVWDNEILCSPMFTNLIFQTFIPNVCPPRIQKNAKNDQAVMMLTMNPTKGFSGLKLLRNNNTDPTKNQTPNNKRLS